MLPSRARLTAACLWLLVLGLPLAAMMLIDPRVAPLARNTLLLAAGTLAIGLPAGVLLGAIVARTRLPGSSTAGVLLASLLFVPLYLQAAAWQTILGVDGWLALERGGPVLLSGWRGAVWVHGTAAIPWVMLFVVIGLRSVDRALEEQALLDAPGRRVLGRVSLPLAAPSIVAAGLWIVVLTGSEITVTDLFRIRTYSEELYTAIAGTGQIEAGSLAVLPGMLFTAWLVLIVLALIAWLVPRGRHAANRPPLRFSLHSWRWPAAVLLVLAVAIIVAMPLAGLTHRAGLVVTRTGATWERSWSLWACLSQVLGSPLRFGREAWWSLALGTLSATMAVAIAAPLAWAARRGGLRALPALLLAAAGLSVPGTVIAAVSIWAFNRPGPLGEVYDSFLLPAAAVTFRALPLAILCLWIAFRAQAEEMFEAASLDGASATTQFFRIALPGVVPALAVAWLVAFAVAVGDLATSILLLPPGYVTLATRIFDRLHTGADEQVAGICLAMAVTFVALGLLVIRRVERGRLTGGSRPATIE